MSSSKTRLAREKKTIEFEITKKDLSFYDEESKEWKAESGDFRIFIGSSSRDIRLEETFENSI